jgi:hypothetical protein
MEVFKFCESRWKGRTYKGRTWKDAGKEHRTVIINNKWWSGGADGGKHRKVLHTLGHYESTPHYEESYEGH